jgi:hypothetical protein
MDGGTARQPALRRHVRSFCGVLARELSEPTSALAHRWCLQCRETGFLHWPRHIGRGRRSRSGTPWPTGGHRQAGGDTGGIANGSLGEQHSPVTSRRATWPGFRSPIAKGSRPSDASPPFGTSDTCHGPRPAYSSPPLWLVVRVRRGGRGHGLSVVGSPCHDSVLERHAACHGQRCLGSAAPHRPAETAPPSCHSHSGTGVWTARSGGQDPGTLHPCSCQRASTWAQPLKSGS